MGRQIQVSPTERPGGWKGLLLHAVEAQRLFVMVATTRKALLRVTGSSLRIGPDFLPVIARVPRSESQFRGVPTFKDLQSDMT